MSNLINWLKNVAKFIVSEFLGQIFAAVVLIAGYISWVHFSSGYAAIAVIVIGIVIWVLIVKAFLKNENTE